MSLAVLGAAGAGWFAREVVRRFRRAKPADDQGVPLPHMLKAALGATPIGIGFADRELRFALVNEAFARFNGLTPEAHVGRPVRDLLPARAWELGEPLLRRVLETGEPVLGVHIRLGEPGGREAVRDFYGNIFPVRSPRGRVLWVGATVLDVTARVRAEEERERLLAALRESEARFRALSESGVIGVLVADPERILEANDAFLELIGYSRPEMLDGRIRWAGSPRPSMPRRTLGPCVSCSIPASCALRKGVPPEGRPPGARGGRRGDHRSSSRWSGPRFVLDVSRAEASRGGGPRERAAVPQSVRSDPGADVGLRLRDPGRFLDVNQAAMAQYGWTREEFLRMTIRDIRPAGGAG